MCSSNSLIGIRKKAAIADHRELFTCAQVILSGNFTHFPCFQIKFQGFDSIKSHEERGAELVMKLFKKTKQSESDFSPSPPR